MESVEPKRVMYQHEVERGWDQLPDGMKLAVASPFLIEGTVSPPLLHAFIFHDEVGDYVMIAGKRWDCPFGLVNWG